MLTTIRQEQINNKSCFECKRVESCVAQVRLGLVMT